MKIKNIILSGALFVTTTFMCGGCGSLDHTQSAPDAIAPAPAPVTAPASTTTVAR